MATSRHLDASTVRALAVESGTDPRTVQRVYQGHRVRGMAGKRARLVLVAVGLLPEKKTDGLDKRAVKRST